MKQFHRYLTISMLVTGLVPSAYSVPPPTCDTAGEPCSAHLPKSGSGDPICLQSSPIDDPRTKYVCAGGTVTLTVTRGDQDAYGDPIACDAATPELSWSDTAGGSAGNQWSYTFQAPATPGFYTVTCTAADGEDEDGQPGYDDPVEIPWTIYVIAVQLVQGPSALCPNEVGRYTATTTPSGFESLITWSGGGHPATGSGGTFDTYWAECHTGDMQVTASYCGTSASKTVHVGADKAPPIVAGIVASRSDSAVLYVNQTYGNAYDNYCGSPPVNARWYVSGAYDRDTKNGALVNDGICVDLSYPGANWVEGMLVWPTPGVYTVQAVVNDQGLCCADDLTHPSAQNKTVAVVGGTIVYDSGRILYVWCPQTENANHRLEFTRRPGQPAGTTYTWEIVSGHGTDKAHIAEYLDGGQRVMVEPDAPSQSPGDVWLRLTYTYQGHQCESTIGLTVLRPDPGTSSWSVSDVCNQVLGFENGTAVRAAGKVVTYTVKDQFGNVMAGETAKWSEWRYLVEGDPSIIGSPTQNQPMDENGQDLDAHTSGFLMPTEQQWICAMPSQTERWVHFDQRITVNGWGASACADVSSHLPAFWRFRVKKWAGTDWNGNPAATASVTAW